MKYPCFMRGWLSILLLVLPIFAFADTDQGIIEAHVMQVLTTNIVLVKSGDEQIYFRLAGMDAPDEQQPYGHQAMAFLIKLIDHKTVILRQVGTDPCGRMVGLMWIEKDNGLDISARMVAAGAAWVYRSYSDDKVLLSLEEHAKADKLGLWALPEADRLPPWEWRKVARREGKETRDSCKIQTDNLSYTNVESDPNTNFDATVY